MKYEDFIFQIMSQGEKELQKVQNSIYELAQKRQTVQGKVNETLSIVTSMNDFRTQLNIMQTEFAELSAIVQELSVKLDTMTKREEIIS